MVRMKFVWKNDVLRCRAIRSYFGKQWWSSANKRKTKVGSQREKRVVRGNFSALYYSSKSMNALWNETHATQLLHYDTHCTICTPTAHTHTHTPTAVHNYYHQRTLFLGRNELVTWKGTTGDDTSVSSWKHILIYTYIM
jgi:hypothetical protein